MRIILPEPDRRRQPISVFRVDIVCRGVVQVTLLFVRARDLHTRMRAVAGHDR